MMDFITALMDIARGAFNLLALAVRGLFKLVGFCADAAKRGPFEHALEAAVAPYLPVLIAKRQKLLRVDDYGVVDNGPWSEELGYFLGNVLLPHLQNYESHARRHLPYTIELVDSFVSEHQPLPPG